MSMMRAALCVSLAFCGVVSPALAAPPDAAKASEEKWRPLFDGATLKNWEVTDFGGQGEVIVKDGQLILSMGEPMTGVTWTGEELPKSNYEVSLEASRQDGVDFFVGLTFPVKETHCSLILGGWGGGVTGLSSINGSDASENETTEFLSYEKGRWYRVRLRVTDDRIQAWLDDEQIIDLDYSKQDISTRIEMEISKPFGLATYMTTGAVRDFRLKELSGDRENQAAP